MPVLMPISNDAFDELAARIAAAQQSERVQGGMLNVHDMVFVRERERVMVGTMPEAETLGIAKQGLWYKFLAMAMWKLHKREIHVSLADVKVLMHEFKPSVPAVIAFESEADVILRLMSQDAVNREIRARGGFSAAAVPLPIKSAEGQQSA